ncbi:phosphoribosyltransferase family protein [Bradyrhizobium sp. LHD-71]|uniref:phosphoribosyltransferase family protein n=1 Tax=Bradyrhizobium sp. LHD-71 TaxID=3072141 RepID=UPI00280CAD00|nr:phosphoribosyltransferase family protein [Bradyrhizobium sp. LHD-71]MDQ8727655.1 phosphoribosyltransferase family protein [Bradyrhizobium sp. LHD-71]
MNYRSIADLNATIERNLHRFPSDIDLVIGIPRSGLLAASMLALAINVPFTDVEGFIAGRVLATGRTRRRDTFDKPVSEIQTIVVLDDSISSGNSMANVRASLVSAYPDKNFVFTAAYGTRPSHTEADLILDVVKHPRIFQWNLFHHDLLDQCCVDIDGVLCLDPTTQENDDGSAYLRFLLEAQRKFIPTKRVGYLVTSRLEKYRANTEEWLARQNITYRELIMLDLPSKSERIRLAPHGRFKGEFYRASDALLFIESEIGQARQIAQVSGKPVLCIENQQMFLPDRISVEALERRASALTHFVRGGLPLKRFARQMLGQTMYNKLKDYAGKQ